MLRLAAERERLTVIDDQIGAPTGAKLVDLTAQMARQAMNSEIDLSGIYYAVATGETSWHGYARFVIEQARQRAATRKVQAIDPVPTSAFPTPARRPHHQPVGAETPAGLRPAAAAVAAGRRAHAHRDPLT